MYTLILPGRSHIVRDDMAEKLIAALTDRRAIELIRVEMNGEGSGEWDVIVNIQQIIALVKHPTNAVSESRTYDKLRMVPTN